MFYHVWNKSIHNPCSIIIYIRNHEGQNIDFKALCFRQFHVLGMSCEATKELRLKQVDLC
jgi:hypothetical protein